MGWRKLVLWASLGVLLLLFYSPTLRAQGGRLIGEAGLELRSSGVFFANCDKLDLINTSFTLGNTNGACTLDLHNAVTKVGTCVGDVSSDFCGSVSFSGRAVDASAVATIQLRTGTALPTGSPPCLAGEVYYLKGANQVQDKTCRCVATPCGDSTDTVACGTTGSPTCSSNRCTAGDTSTKWECAPSTNPLFSDGGDGSFFFPVPTGGTTCSTYSSTPTASSGAVCPGTINGIAFCNSCTNVTGGTASAGCICTLTTNSRWASAGVSGGEGTDGTPSTILHLTRFYVGKKNVVTIHRTPTGGCGTSAASDLIIKVLGDATLDGDGTNGAKIDMKGKGECGGNTSFALAVNSAGGGGGSTLFSGGAGGAAGTSAVAGSAGISALWDWQQGGPDLLNLAGGGGAKPPIGVNGAQEATFVGDYGPRFGAGGGASGNSTTGANTGTWTCINTAGNIAGAGGGGVQLDVYGNLIIGGAAKIDTSGAAVSGSVTQVAGGGGSGSILIRYSGTCTDNGGACSNSSSAFTMTGGTAGTSCGSGTNACGAGGAGGAGAANVVKIN